MIGSPDLDIFVNSRTGPVEVEGRAGGDVSTFHSRLPGYAHTPLTAAPSLAERLGIGELWIKDESLRLGLPSFKILGASWATYRALERRVGISLSEWGDIDALAALVRERVGPLRLAAATDGNHGRAVARVARWLRFGARIFVPEGTSAARRRAIEEEGAEAHEVVGSYEAAVRRSAEEAADDCLVISDTSWPGYEEVPRWVIEGYETIFHEVDTQAGDGTDVVMVQMGVGALAASVVRHYRRSGSSVRLIGVEPTSAACVLASLRADRVVSVPGPHRSIMAGLNCDTPSLVAWPLVARGLDAVLAADDEAARVAMRRLAAIEVVSGETGASGLAGLEHLISSSDGALRERLGLTANARVLLISTEGATDPEAYAAIVCDAASSRATPTIP